MPETWGRLSELEGDFVLVNPFFSNADYPSGHFVATGDIFDQQYVISLDLHCEVNQGAVSIHHQSMSNFRKKASLVSSPLHLHADACRHALTTPGVEFTF